MARLLFLVNDLSTMNPSQSTFGLICHASQVHEVWLAESAALTATMDGVVAIARPWQVGVSIDSVATLEPQHIPLLTCDGVWVRTNPGRADRAPGEALTLLLLAQRQGVLIRNSPLGLMQAGSKSFLSGLPHDTIPRTWSGSCSDELLRIIDGLEEMAVIKPAVGTRGEGVRKVHRDMPDKAERVRTALAHGPVVLQNYLPEAPDGDLRVHLINGQLLELEGRPCAVLRRPQAGEWRSNVALGASRERGVLSQTDVATCRRVGPILRELGLWHVGLDLVGSKIVELNVFSPGGLADAGSFEGRDFIAAVVDSFFEEASPQ